MKLRYVSLVLLQICALSLSAMSSDEKAEFKRQLKATQTSAEMEQLVNAKLSHGTFIRLELYESESRTIEFQIYGVASGPDATQVDHDVRAVLEETFFTDMQSFYI